MPDAAPRHGRSLGSRLVATALLVVVAVTVLSLYGVDDVDLPGAPSGAAPAATHASTPSPAPAIVGRTFYMSPAGSDSADGLTISTPFRTLGGWTGSLAPGDTVLVRGGTYHTGHDTTETWRTSLDGTDGGPITFKAYPGETPIFDGQASTQQFAVLSDASYLTFDGLTVRDYQPIGNGVFLIADASHHIVVRNLTAIGNMGSSPYTDQFLYVASGGHDVLIDGVSVTGTTAAAVMIGGGTPVSNVTVSGSHLFGNGRGIIDGDITIGSRIAGNVIEDNAMAQIHFHANGAGRGSTDAVVTANTLRGSVGLWVESLFVTTIDESDDCIASSAPFVTGYPLASSTTWTLGEWQASGRGSGTTVGSCP